MNPDKTSHECNINLQISHILVPLTNVSVHKYYNNVKMIYPLQERIYANVIASPVEVNMGLQTAVTEWVKKMMYDLSNFHIGDIDHSVQF